MRIVLGQVDELLALSTHCGAMGPDAFLTAVEALGVLSETANKAAANGIVHPNEGPIGAPVLPWFALIAFCLMFHVNVKALFWCTHPFGKIAARRAADVDLEACAQASAHNHHIPKEDDVCDNFPTVANDYTNVGNPCVGLEACGKGVDVADDIHHNDESDAYVNRDAYGKSSAADVMDHYAWDEGDDGWMGNDAWNFHAEPNNGPEDDTMQIWSPDAQPSHVVIFLHGINSGPSFAEKYARHAHAHGLAHLVCAPCAPFASNWGKRRWTSYCGPTGTEVDVMEFEKSRAHVSLVIDELTQRYPSLPIILVGYSQGGSIALDIGLRHAGVNAVICLRSVFQAESFRNLDMEVACRGLRVFAIHGLSDWVVPATQATTSYAFLEYVLGTAVRTELLPMGHVDESLEELDCTTRILCHEL